MCAGDPSVKAVACCHPAFFGKEKEFAEAAKVPVCMLPAEGDNIDAAKEVLDAKPFADKCVYKHFDDQVHGFLGAFRAHCPTFAVAPHLLADAVPILQHSAGVCVSCNHFFRIHCRPSVNGENL
jgi:dienelactone hydrolase